MGIFARKKSTSRSNSNESLDAATQEKDVCYNKDYSGTTILAGNLQPPQNDHSRRSSSTRKRLMRRLSGSFHDASNSTRSMFKNRNQAELEAVTLDHLPDLILDLESAVATSAERSARALRMLFALSEHAEGNDEGIEQQQYNRNRIEMVHQNSAEDRALVPVLLQFLNRCQPNSNEQHMTLLVLNNISIPLENKKVIALDYGGARILSKLLCEDPSCHLMAIVLVNLTFSGVDLRRQLLKNCVVATPTDDEKSQRKRRLCSHCIGRVSRICLASGVVDQRRVSCEDRATIEECCENSNETHTSADRLSILMAEDQRLRQEKRHEQNTGFLPVILEENPKILPMTPAPDQLYPETTRWCLSALRNLTRPCKCANAAHTLIQSSTYSLILQFLSIHDENGEPANTPHSWDCNSMQDTALSIVMNLAACPVSREYMNEDQSLKILSAITKYPDQVDLGLLDESQRKQMDLQCLKARMALSYLIGSEGHFGQSKLRPSASTVNANESNSDLILSETDIHLLVELLDNALGGRGKEGSGGYSFASFGLNYVLFSLRCLLTHTTNQLAIATQVGTNVNVLLMKALALYVTRSEEGSMDADSAEYASFCLYLLSNYTFEDHSFLPNCFAPPTDNDENAGDLAAKILTRYLSESDDIRPAGKHAAEQLLLRLSYLCFGGDVDENVNALDWDPEIMRKLTEVKIETRPCGAKPSKDIFSRPILRSRKPRNGSESKAPWNNLATLSIFQSALQAVQQLSYGSTKVRHADKIDDIVVANHIAASANGERTESYNFLWTWEDSAQKIQRNLERQTSIESNNGNLFSRFSRSGESTQERPALLRLSCGMCSSDTTVA